MHRRPGGVGEDDGLREDLSALILRRDRAGGRRRAHGSSRLPEHEPRGASRHEEPERPRDHDDVYGDGDSEAPPASPLTHFECV